MGPTPHFFIVRPDIKRSLPDGRVHTVPGPIVPLVAIDELPTWLEIADVPRALSVEQTVGLYNLGTASRSKDTYAVRITHQATSVAHQQSAVVKSPEAKAQNHAATNGPRVSSSPSAQAPSGSKPHVPAGAAPSAAHPADRMRAHWLGSQARNDAGKDITGSMHNPQPQAQGPPQLASQARPNALASTSTSTLIHTSKAGTAPTPPTTTPVASARNPEASPSTEYCRHWCHYGTCRWGLQCRYLHAMPTTQAELAEIGLSEIPGWWVATAAGFGKLALSGLGNGAHRQQHQLHQQAQGHQQGQQGQHPPGQQQNPANNGHVSGAAVGGTSHTNNQTNNHPGLGPDAGTDTNTSNDGGFDPRDVRLGLLRQLGTSTGTLPHTETTTGNTTVSISGPGGIPSKKAIKKAQLRETVALLKELGLSVNVGNNNSNGGKARKRDREKDRGMNPLDKARGKGAADKEVVLRAARAEMAAVAAAAGSSSAGANGRGIGSAGVGAGRSVVHGQNQGQGQGQGQAAVPGAIQRKVVEGGMKGGGQTAGSGGRAVGGQRVGKLVDV